MIRKLHSSHSNDNFKCLVMSMARISYTDTRNAENNRDRLPALVDELIRLKVDVLVVAAGNEVRAAKNATKTIPIVGLNLGNPVQSGLIESLAHPRLQISPASAPNLFRVGRQTARAAQGDSSETCSVSPCCGTQKRRHLNRR